MPNVIFKPVTSTISSRQEQITFTGMNGSELVFTLCDRTQTTSTEANYFSSFNLPYEYAALSTGSTLATQYPEIYQLNRDKIVIVPIPKQSYSELIDGRSITMDVPQLSGTTGINKNRQQSCTWR